MLATNVAYSLEKIKDTVVHSLIIQLQHSRVICEEISVK